MFSVFFIRRPVFAMVISVVILILGGLSIPILPIESTPDITPPTVKVTTNFPGASAQIVEQTVTTPIEQQVNGVEDMIYMSSKSTAAGNLDLTVSFEIGTDPDMAAVLTQNRVSIAEPLLPEEVKRNGVTTKKQSTSMVLMVNLISPDQRFDDIYISNYATTRIKDVLARIPGVGEVQVFGAKNYGMRIWLNPELLKARGLTSDDVMAAIREQNVQVAAGKVGAPPNAGGLDFEYTLLTQGRLETTEEFENIIIKTGDDGRLVRIRDVARVELGAQDYSWYVDLDGAPSIALGIYQLPGANALGVAQEVREAMTVLEEDFPEGLEQTVVYDPTEYIEASINEVVETLLIAIVLVILSVYLFLQDFRTTLIPSVTIPVSLIGTFAVMQAMGMSINNFTLFGLVLAIGIVVDDSITVVENVMRNIDTKGLSPQEATEEAMKEIQGAVIATTLVLLAVFIPTTLMPGLTGLLYKQFAITISVATVFSSLNALTLSPALCAILLRPSPKKRGWFFTAFNTNFDKVRDGYMTWTQVMLRKAGVFMVLFVGLVVLAMFGIVSLPGGFLPDEDQGYCFANVQLPNGASMDRTGEVLDRINEMVEDLPGVRGSITIGGYSFLDGVQGSNYGAVIITMVPWDERDETIFDIMAMLQGKLSGIQEGIAFAFGPPPITGLGNATGFTMELQDAGGLGLGNLQTFAQDLAQAGNQSPLVTRVNQNFRADVPQLFIDIDRERVKSYGIPLSTVFSTLQANLGSAYVNDFNLFGRTWKVQVQADEEFRSQIDDILKLEVRAPDGRMVPMGTLARIENATGPAVINRFNMFPSASITGGPTPGNSSGQATAEMARIADEILPAGMSYSWSGVTYQEKAAGNLAPLIFTLAFLFGFLFLAAQYESWTIPLAVMFEVPLAMLGAAAFTWGRLMDNNIYTQIGLVLLIGLSAKTAILIVEFAKQLREEGKSPREAATEAAKLRFRPILMTAISTLLGNIPLVIASGAGSASRQALGTAVFGGLFIGIAAGVFFIPLFYYSVQATVERLTGKSKPKEPNAPLPAEG